MTTSQAILSLSPTSCHVFIAIIEQNLCHNRLISWMILPWAGKRPGPCVSVWTRCYNNLLTGGCWERSRNRSCFERALPLNHWKKQEMRDNFCVVWCGVVSQRDTPELWDREEMQQHHPGRMEGGWHVLMPQPGELGCSVCCRDTKLQGQELNGDRWKRLAKWFAPVRDG